MEQLSAVTQVVVSVMNLSDRQQQDGEDSLISGLVETQHNRSNIVGYCVCRDQIKTNLILCGNSFKICYLGLLTPIKA